MRVSPSGHQPLVGGSARRLPLLGLLLSLASLLSLFVCLDALLLHDVPGAISALAFLGTVVGLSGLVRAGATAARILRSSRRLAADRSGARELPGHPGVLVVPGSVPMAWCSGLLRPRVAVTEGALTRLGPQALAAVLAHEDHHARRRDGLRLASIDVLASGLFLLPGAGPAGERYAALLELAADRAAAASVPQGERSLAAAMLVLDAPGTGVAADRVDRLLGRPVHVEIAGRTLTAGAALLVLLIATGVGCTLATGCTDIFLLREDDATAQRFELLPVVATVAALLAFRVVPGGRAVSVLPEPA